MLRPREPRAGDPRRHAVHGHDRRAPASPSTRKTGKLVWNIDGRRRSADSADYAITHAPLVVKDKVIVGIGRRRPGRSRLHRRLRREDRQGSCGASTRFPGPASRATRRGRATRGRPAAPASGTAAPTIRTTNLVVLRHRQSRRRTGTAASRLGDNLYSDSVVALDADTGKLKWHYQFTPHDELDYDSTQVPVLADIAVAGPAAQGDAVGQPQRRRCTCSIASTGEFLLGQAVREGELDGRLRREGPAAARAGQVPTPEGTLIMPHVLGATNWAPPAYSPRTGLFYVASWENTGTLPSKASSRGPPAPTRARRRWAT